MNNVTQSNGMALEKHTTFKNISHVTSRFTHFACHLALSAFNQALRLFWQATGSAHNPSCSESQARSAEGSADSLQCIQLVNREQGTLFKLF